MDSWWIHIANRYLNLYPVVKRKANKFGMGFRNKLRILEKSGQILIFKNQLPQSFQQLRGIPPFAPSVNKQDL